MLRQITALREPLPAAGEITHQRPLPGVRSPMHRHRGSLRKVFSADIASVWFLPRVGALMLFECLWSRKLLPASLAGAALVYLPVRTTIFPVMEEKLTPGMSLQMTIDLALLAERLFLTITPRPTAIVSSLFLQHRDMHIFCVLVEIVR